MSGRIQLVRQFLHEFPFNLEVIYVVERSPDDTLPLAREAARDAPGVTIHDNGPQGGKGYAVQSGMGLATGDIIFYNDTDLSVPLHQLFYFLATMVRSPETQVLIGNRRRLTTRGLWRRAISSTFHRGLSLFSRLPGSWDTQCGFKAFRRKSARRLFDLQRLHGFAFDVEILMLARSLGYCVSSETVLWLNDERSTVRPLMDFGSIARDVYALRRRFARNSRILLSDPYRTDGAIVHRIRGRNGAADAFQALNPGVRNRG